MRAYILGTIAFWFLVFVGCLLRLSESRYPRTTTSTPVKDARFAFISFVVMVLGMLALR